MMYLTWQAKLFGLTKRRVFLVAFLLCCVVLLFPWALRTGTIVWWILSVVFLVIIGTLYPTRLIAKDKSKNSPMVMDSEPMVSVENNASQELIDQTLSAQRSIRKTKEDDELVEETKKHDELVEETKKDDEPLGEIEENLVNNNTNTMLVQPKLNIETSVTKTSGTIVSSGEYRRKSTLVRNTIALRIGFRRAAYSHKEYNAKKEESTFLAPKCSHSKKLIRRRNSSYRNRYTIRPLLEAGVSLSDKSPNSLDNVISLEELIDLGFKAKHVDNFEQAAYYFSRALALDPKPDIAFYLILDCYWLWGNLGERKYALTQLDEYVETYLPRFDSELRHQFADWMTREDIHKN